MIETKRLILRPVTIDDIYKAIMSCPMLSLYLPKGSPYSDSEIFQHITKRVEHWHKGFGSFIILLKDTPKVKLGYTGVEVSPNLQYSDIRYAIKEGAQGKGYAYEAAKAVLQYTFSLGKHRKIYGVAVKENSASINILKKLGMDTDNAAIIYDHKNLQTLSINKPVE